MQKNIKDHHRLFFILVLAVFMMGSGAVFFLSQPVRGLSAWAGIGLKSAVGTGLSGAVFYLFIFRRWLEEIAARMRTEDRLSEAVEKEKALQAAAVTAAAAHKRSLAEASAVAAIAHEKELTAIGVQTAAERKRHADKVHDLEQQIVAGEQRLKAAYQRCADIEQELRVAKAGLEQKVKEGVRELLEPKVKERTRKLEDDRDALKAALEARERALRDEQDKLAKMGLLVEERDMRVIEIKKEVNRLSRELGQAEPYWRG